MTDISNPEPRPAPRISFVSLGCPKALVDSERILTQLRAEGYELPKSHAGADAVIVNTCGFLDSAKAESLAAIGAAMAENGRVIVTGCMGAEPDSIRDAYPECGGDHRPAGLRQRDGGGARGRAGAARPVRRPHPGTGGEAHAAPLRLSEDLRGLPQPLLVLHHPETARRPRVAPGGRGVARGGEAGQGGGEGTARHLAGHQRLWPRHPLRREPLARPRGRGALSRSHSRARLARGLGAAALRLPLSACRRSRAS